jgi:hypothetical protein
VASMAKHHVMRSEAKKFQNGKWKFKIQKSKKIKKRAKKERRR